MDQQSGRRLRGRGRQGSVESLEQRLVRYRLCDVVHCPHLERIYGVVPADAHEDYPYVRQPGDHAPGQVRTEHAGHYDIEDDDVV